MSSTVLWIKDFRVFSTPYLDAAGLVALADLKTIAIRTALTGTSTYLDMFVICPGIHLQQNAPELNGGELPQVASMGSGFVFRIENPGTVAYLQRVGRTGHLINVQVSVRGDEEAESMWRWIWSAWWTSTSSFVSSACYLTAILLTIFTGWKGYKEPGVQGDMLVLLSQDRWIRMKGLNDDLKLVTSGQWLRDMVFWEQSIASASTLLVYLDAALASNATQLGKTVLLCLLFASVGLLAVSNECLMAMEMFGATLKVVGEDKPDGFERRMEMVEYLVDKTKKHEWAIRAGLMHAKSD
ncbi:hypothetical protein GLAREA_00068 [Glarea lozoyensis ATCC 20868]|uniref:Uncharacterized protein n=1 Tax=Glarea lozoyensis (strain ATCC 20868 / MF5171) TaxID=1116229 RepID=S3CTD1_GLAL2|nr:uncharacterized protein GLAREA_00068 [Glarea lozoyensis ATCC 20868]EPE28910.1 hypothetical protein GLAREA_00068 [Glarea lozoyensis ATCC 20868]